MKACFKANFASNLKKANITRDSRQLLRGIQLLRSLLQGNYFGNFSKITIALKKADISEAPIIAELTSSRILRGILIFRKIMK